MLVEIKKNVITEALKRSGQTRNDPLDLLFLMAICARRGAHVVWTPVLENDRTLRKELSALLGEANVNALCFSGEKHLQDVGWLIKHTTVKTIISYENESRVDGCIIINPFRESAFQPYTELFLLVENILDADFFKIVLNVYRKKNKLCSYECSFYPLMGGGVTIANVMQNEVKLKHHFCFAISDSDRQCPNGPKGQTCLNLQETLVGAPDYYGVYTMNDVMEIENLVPQRVVRELFPLGAGEVDIFSKDASFFDMKFGLRLVDLVNDKVNDYWKRLLPEKHAFFNQRDRLKKGKKKNDFEKAIKNSDCQIVNGFSSTLLKRVLNADHDAKGILLKKNIDAYNKLQQTEYVHLSPAQEKEWDRIGKNLFSWSCSMKAI